MNLLICIFENMQGMIDQEFPVLFKFVMDELIFTQTLENQPKKYVQSILQAIAMAFLYNSQMAFQYLEQNGQTLAVFQAWFVHMDAFKSDFEYRRNIFGLSSIIKTPENVLPQIVNQKLPEMMN